MSRGNLQLTFLCSGWENQPSSAPTLALVQRCGIFQENFKIITERERQLKTDLEEGKENKRAGAGFPRYPQNTGRWGCEC